MVDFEIADIYLKRKSWFSLLSLFFSMDKTQPKLTLPNQNYGRNVPKPYS